LLEGRRHHAVDLSMFQLNVETISIFLL